MEALIYIAVAWVALINIIGFILCAADKSRARKHQWRIPERNLFITALLGGSIGVYSAMLLFRHKTKHLRFMAGIPLIFIIECVALYYIAFRI
jgi:uncharacterized membrane protein YsdA (DUF1294 family)